MCEGVRVGVYDVCTDDSRCVTCVLSPGVCGVSGRHVD